MDNHTPPYNITPVMLELISEISEKIGRISSFGNLDSKPHLRKNNMIKSIHSSLKTEANSLSLSEVKDVQSSAFNKQRQFEELLSFSRRLNSY